MPAGTTLAMTAVVAHGPGAVAVEGRALCA
jgi:hypothetical protein